MIWLNWQHFWLWIPILFLTILQQLMRSEAFLKKARIEEIPFSLSEKEPMKMLGDDLSRGIYAISNLEKQRGFFHLFHVPYILCFFAAKGKWPFIPTFMQARVDAAARTLFAHEDGFIKQFCKKFIQIKECFRPLIASTTAASVDALSKQKATACTCTTESPIVYFDRDHIGSVSSETILNTIEFLESFLPTPTKKTKRRKNRVRGRVDEMEVE